MLPTVKRQSNWLPPIFNDFFNEDWFPFRGASTTSPAINVKEEEKAFIVEIAAPGMSKDDFKVQVNDQNQLVVSMEKKQENQEEDKSFKYLRREFHFSRFEQTLILPDNVDKEGIKAKTCHGILRIKLPKLENVPARKSAQVIEIQ
jgi:HSP20 family protein